MHIAYYYIIYEAPQTSKAHPKSFKVVVDNLDMAIKTQFMRVEKFQNQSQHFVNSYAVQSRIDHSHLPDVHADSCLNSSIKNAMLLLPSIDDDQSLRKLFMTHVAQIMATDMKFFIFSFDGVVDRHIKHQYYEEMSPKSKVVSL